MTLTAEDIIERLQLVPHPCEGGYFRETYRSRLVTPSDIEVPVPAKVDAIPSWAIGSPLAASKIRPWIQPAAPSTKLIPLTSAPATTTSSAAQRNAPEQARLFQNSVICLALLARTRYVPSGRSPIV